MVHDGLGFLAILPRQLHEFIDIPDVFSHELWRVSPDLVEQTFEPV